MSEIESPVEEIYTDQQISEFGSKIPTSTLAGRTEKRLQEYSMPKEELPSLKDRQRAAERLQHHENVNNPN